MAVHGGQTQQQQRDPEDLCQLPRDPHGAFELRDCGGLPCDR